MKSSILALIAVLMVVARGQSNCECSFNTLSSCPLVVLSSVDGDGTNRCVADVAATCDVYVCEFGGGSFCTVTTGSSLKFTGTENICTEQTTFLVTPTEATAPSSDVPTALPPAPPTASPTAPATDAPTESPTAPPPAPPPAPPTDAPTASPTAAPTASPTAAPTASPTAPPPAPPTTPPTPGPSLAPSPGGAPTLGQILGVANFQVTGFSQGPFFAGDLNLLQGAVLYADFTPLDATTPQLIFEIGSDFLGVAMHITNGELLFFAGSADIPLLTVPGISVGNRYTLAIGMRPNSPFTVEDDGELNVTVAVNGDVLDIEEPDLGASLVDSVCGVSLTGLSDSFDYGYGDVFNTARGGPVNSFQGGVLGDFAYW
eukprot:CAMPEP_0182450878 /NCGR_PEP_ID=MMETSP1172-20130603/43414_1 /TAXON_ID=708627 /ORGANISM="Timspurckia oligopyrenoides, Strain CCMP3278" /LENGTH=372 /DNA_ID=CAMNT_0024648601 /DNA_START=482 /DNA_END=1597 /DNA_ORIENTATION=-